MTLNNSMSITPIIPTVRSRDVVRHGSFLGENSGPLRVRSPCTSTAGEICGRSTGLIEYDSLYCDTIIRRYEQLTGRQAILQRSGLDFDTIQASKLVSRLQTNKQEEV